MIYTIEADNNITAFATGKEAKAAMTGDLRAIWERKGTCEAGDQLAG